MATLEKAPTSNFWSTSLNGAINDSVTTITLNSTVGLQAPGRLVINRQDSTGQNTPSAREVISFTGISGSDLTGVTRGADNSTARSHADGSLVESAIVVGNWDTLYDVINEEHDLDGTHDTTKVVDLTTAQTLTNKTLTSPVINTPSLTTTTANRHVVYSPNPAKTTSSTSFAQIDSSFHADITVQKGALVLCFLTIGGFTNSNAAYATYFDIATSGTTSATGGEMIYGSQNYNGLGQFTFVFYCTGVSTGAQSFYPIWKVSNVANTATLAQYSRQCLTAIELTPPIT
ncbi:MAG: hypothetical protein LC127_04460 [Chitinophagales bacterium]|nr:hypothetical protein [Chitinophagales bacterium]